MAKGCTSCHDAHGSNGPKLIKQSDVVTLCQSCHGDLGKHYHPVKSDKPDGRGQPMTCTSCHDPHAAEYPGLLQREPKRELCIQCHDPSMAPGAGGGAQR